MAVYNVLRTEADGVVAGIHGKELAANREEVSLHRDDGWSIPGTECA